MRSLKISENFEEELFLSYFIDHASGSSSGIAKKVLAQIKYLQKNGIFCKLYLITPFREKEKWKRNLENIPFEIYGYRGWLGRMWFRFWALLVIATSGKKRKSLTYLRASLLLPHEICLIQRQRYFVEVNSNNKIEYDNRFRCAGKLYAYTEKKLIQSASGVITVTKELAEKYSSRFPKSKVIHITNGIEFPRIKLDSETCTFKYDLVFMATEGKPWHGIEQFMKLSEELRTLKFLLVSRSNNEYEKSRETPPNLTLLDANKEFDESEILKQCVVGVSSLNLDFLHMHEGSPLKTRTYLANGLPVIVGYDDFIFGEKSNWRLDIRSYSNLDLPSEIVKFVNSWRSRRVEISELTKIDIRTTEKMRANFFRSSLRVS
jgi:hypothetical protein